MGSKRYNAYFSREHSLLYIATPKVACTTLKWWFAKLVGADVLVSSDSESFESDPDLVIHDALSRSVPDMTEANEAGLAEALSSSDYFRYCVVRNPFTRAFSGWQSKWLLREPLQSGAYRSAFDDREINNESDIRDAFEAFLRVLADITDSALHDPHMAPQADLLEPDVIQYSLVSHIENTSELEGALARHLGDAYRNPFVGSDGAKNVSLLSYSSDWISDESARLIRKIYAKDFELFGYDQSVPLGAEPLPDAAMVLAARSIKLLRGRNQRIGVLIRDRVPWMRGEAARKYDIQSSSESAETDDLSAHLSLELASIATLFRQSLARRDQTIADQVRQLCQMKDELIRAEAQLELLKDVLLGSHDEDRL